MGSPARAPGGGARVRSYRGGVDANDPLFRLEATSGRAAGSIEPLDEHLLIEPVEDETETKAGLIIPASAESSCVSGVVVAVGEDVTGVAAGDKVLHPRGAGYEVRLGGSPKRILHRREIIARVVD
jgi:chaperonin GroES